LTAEERASDAPLFCAHFGAADAEPIQGTVHFVQGVSAKFHQQPGASFFWSCRRTITIPKAVSTLTRAKRNALE
jgi:hypothetical protein